MAGEIDIIEGIDNQSSNRMALHSGTSNSCTLNVMGSQGMFTGDILTTNCYTTAIVDVGCVIQDTDTRSYGYGFNDAQGGVFALVWDSGYHQPNTHTCELGSATSQCDVAADF